MIISEKLKQVLRDEFLDRYGTYFRESGWKWRYGHGGIEEVFEWFITKLEKTDR